MKLKDMNLTYKKRRVITYNTYGDKALYHNKEVAPIMGNLYAGKFEYDNYGIERCNLYIFYPGVKVGVYAGKTGTSWDHNTLVEECISAGFYTANGFTKNICRRIKKEQHIMLTELLMLEHVAPVLVAPAKKAKEAHRARLKADHEEKERKRMEEERKFLEKKNAELESAVNDAIDVIRNGGILKNDSVFVYESEYSKKEYSIVNYLMRIYGVNCPLRTRGWINSKLVNVTIKDGKSEHCRYYRGKGCRVSSVFFRCMNELIATVIESND